jgi:hypothetical protein
MLEFTPDVCYGHAQGMVRNDFSRCKEKSGPSGFGRYTNDHSVQPYTLKTVQLVFGAYQSAAENRVLLF